MTKTFRKLRVEENFLNVIKKYIYKKPMVNIIVKGKKKKIERDRE